MFKNILLLLIFIGIILVLIPVIQDKKECPKNEIIYRYIPRTFNEQQANPAFPSVIFTQMFNSVDPWIEYIANTNQAKQGSTNNFFISQM